MALVSRDTLPASFNKAFERLRATVNTEDARTFASTTMEDVWNAARRIERQLEAKRSLRNFNRIQKFLAGIEQYSKIVEVLCNQTPYLPFVWAPIKLFLEIAQANLSALDKLIDAYAMIGEAMPRFDRLSAAFKDDQDFQQVLGQFYEDILEFHRRAYKFFRRRAWKIVFESLWKTFNLRFEFILESLRKHRDLIDQEANAIDIVEAKAWRSKQLEEIQRRRVERAEDLDRMEGERLSRQIREAVAWLGANEEQEDTLAKLLRAHDSINSHWSLTTPTILSWIEQGRENLYIWLNGKPGAGKSVICSKIIEHIQEKTGMVILFYFCHHFQTSKEPISEVLKSFATQLLVANPGLAPYILDTFANAGRKPTKKYLAEILEKLIASSRPIRIVVDGLDEWSHIDQEDSVKDLFRIRGPSQGACKILFSSRKTAHLTKLLQSQPTFRLDDYGENITSNIASFVQERLTRLRQTFASELIDELEGEILKRADGMFLWVRLILHTLEGLYYESDVRETIKTLPNDLDALYERILSRICRNGRDPNQRRSVRILQWMLVAQRPLRQAELESGIILDDQVPQITPATRARGNVLSLCFPLIEIDDDPGGYVHFCHFTALEFLQKSNTYAALQPAQAHVTVSLSCVLYLATSLNFVDPSVAERDIREQVIQRFHELLLYACDHWLDHLQALADRPTRLLAEQDTLSSLQQGLESLSHLHTELALSKGWTCGQQTDAIPSSRDDLWSSLEVSPSVCKLLDQGLMSKGQVSAMASVRPGQYIPSYGDRDPTLFTSVRARYKSITEDILSSENPTDALMREFRVSHSSGSYLCSYQGCPRASQGFSSVELRQQHEENHAPRFQCSSPACGFWKCSSEAALRKHTAKYHDGQDVSCVPNFLNSSLRGMPQEKSLFRLATPRMRSPMQDYPAYESLARKVSLARKLSSEGTTPHYVTPFGSSFQYRRNSSGHLVQVPSPALLQPQDQSLQNYVSQLFLLGEQNDRRLQRHQVPTGWQATISNQERIANVLQMSVLKGIDPVKVIQWESAEFRKAPDRESYNAATRRYIDIPIPWKEPTITVEKAPEPPGDYPWPPRPCPPRQQQQDPPQIQSTLEEQTKQAQARQSLSGVSQQTLREQVQQLQQKSLTQYEQEKQLLQYAQQVQQQQHNMVKSFRDSPPLDYEAARASLRAHPHAPRLSSVNPTHTTSVAGAPGTLTGGTLASDAVRTGEASRESSGWNLDLYGYRRPMTDPLGLRTEDRTLPKPSSPDIYPGLASVESPQNFLPSPGLQQKTDYPSAVEDLENSLEGRYEDAPGSLRGGNFAQDAVRTGAMSGRVSNSNPDQWSNRRPRRRGPSKMEFISPKLNPPLSSGLKDGRITPDAGTPEDLLGRYYSNRDQSFPMAASMLPHEEEEEDPFSYLQTDTTIGNYPDFESFDNVFR